MERRTFQSGEWILKQGDPGSNAYRVLSGQVEVILHRDNQTISLAVLGPGEIFGEMGMIDDKPRSASVRAMETAEVEMVSPQEFNTCILTNPQKLVPYLKSFFERLRRSNEHFNPLSARSTPAAARKNPPPEPENVHLKAATEHLRQRILKSEFVARKFPFRMGRWSDDFQSDVFISNDLFIRDEFPYQISRNHCAIEREGLQFYILDRGSALGTTVNGVHIGGKGGDTVAPLRSGENELRLGGETSPYLFHLTLNT